MQERSRDTPLLIGALVVLVVLFVWYASGQLGRGGLASLVETSGSETPILLNTEYVMKQDAEGLELNYQTDLRGAVYLQNTGIPQAGVAGGAGSSMFGSPVFSNTTYTFRDLSNQTLAWNKGDTKLAARPEYPLWPGGNALKLRDNGISSKAYGKSVFKFQIAASPSSARKLQAGDRVNLLTADNDVVARGLVFATAPTTLAISLRGWPGMRATAHQLGRFIMLRSYVYPDDNSKREVYVGEPVRIQGVYVRSQGGIDNVDVFLGITDGKWTFSPVSVQKPVTFMWSAANGRRDVEFKPLGETRGMQVDVSGGNALNTNLLAAQPGRSTFLPKGLLTPAEANALSIPAMDSDLPCQTVMIKEVEGGSGASSCDDVCNSKQGELYKLHGRRCGAESGATGAKCFKSVDAKTGKGTRSCSVAHGKPVKCSCQLVTDKRWK